MVRVGLWKPDSSCAHSKAVASILTDLGSSHPPPPLTVTGGKPPRAPVAFWRPRAPGWQTQS